MPLMKVQPFKQEDKDALWNMLLQMGMLPATPGAITINVNPREKPDKRISVTTETFRVVYR